MFRLNVSPTSVKKSLLKLISYTLLLLILACPEPEHENPQKADCPNGKLPCEEDSTICCDVICPDNFHLCGEDSTDCCLNLSSHDMHWAFDTIFYYNTGPIHNYVQDIAFVNDSVIWIVGDFMIPDSTGAMTNYERSFNYLAYENDEWELSRMDIPGITSVPGLNSIFVINENDIWVGGYGPFHWNGSSWEVFGPDVWPTFDNYGKCFAIWGSSSNDVFFSSVSGQINHWNGSGFERMDTPTETVITDIRGTGPNNVWAVGSDFFNGDATALYYNGVEWTLIYQGTPEDYGSFNIDSLSTTLLTLEVFDDAINILSLYGIYTTTIDEAPKASIVQKDIWYGYPAKMRGYNRNNIFICGLNSVLTHWNGETYYDYPVPFDINFRSMNICNNQIIAVGRISRGIAIAKGEFFIR